MRLARLIPDPVQFEGVSLRQAYVRLGIATEPKSRRQLAQLPSLPNYVLHANRLLPESLGRTPLPESRNALIDPGPNPDMMVLIHYGRALRKHSGADDAWNEFMSCD